MHSFLFDWHLIVVLGWLGRERTVYTTLVQWKAQKSKVACFVTTKKRSKWSIVEVDEGRWSFFCDIFLVTPSQRPSVPPAILVHLSILPFSIGLGKEYRISIHRSPPNDGQMDGPLNQRTARRAINRLEWKFSGRPSFGWMRFEPSSRVNVRLL